MRSKNSHCHDRNRTFVTLGKRVWATFTFFYLIPSHFLYRTFSDPKFSTHHASLCFVSPAFTPTSFAPTLQRRGLAVCRRMNVTSQLGQLTELSLASLLGR